MTFAVSHGGNRLLESDHRCTDCDHPPERSIDPTSSTRAQQRHGAAQPRPGERRYGGRWRRDVPAAQSGTTGSAVTLPLFGAAWERFTIDVKRGAGAPTRDDVALPVWGAAIRRKPYRPRTSSRRRCNAALAGEPPWRRNPCSPARRRRASATRSACCPVPADPNLSFDSPAGVDTTATSSGLTPRRAQRCAVTHRASASTALAQVAGTAGNNGTAPGATELTGNEAAKTGHLRARERRPLQPARDARRDGRRRH